MKVFLFFLAGLASFSLPNHAFAQGGQEQMYIVVSGLSRHFNAENFGTKLSSSNPGGGVQYERLLAGRRVFFASAGQYENSMRTVSHWVGGGFKARFLLSDRFDKPRIDLGGMMGGLSGYQFRNGGWFPVMVPVISFGTNHVVVDTYVIPPIKGASPLTLGFQLRTIPIRW